MKKFLVMLLLVFIVSGCNNEEVTKEPKVKTPEEVLNDVLASSNTLSISGFVSSIDNNVYATGYYVEKYYNGIVKDSNVEVTVYSEVGNTSDEHVRFDVIEEKKTSAVNDFSLKNTNPFNVLKQSLSNCSEVKDDYYTCTTKYISSYDNYNTIVVVESKINSKSLDGEIVDMYTKKYTPYNIANESYATLSETQELLELGVYEDLTKLSQYGYRLNFNENERLVILGNEEKVENTSAENIVANAVRDVSGGSADFKGRVQKVKTEAGYDSPRDLEFKLENGIRVSKESFNSFWVESEELVVLNSVDYVKANYDSQEPPFTMQIVEFIDPTTCENNKEEQVLTCNVKEYVETPKYVYNYGDDSYSTMRSYLVWFGEVKISYDKENINSITYDTFMLFDYVHYDAENYENILEIDANKLYEMLDDTELIDIDGKLSENEIFTYPHSFSAFQLRGILTFK